MYNESMVFKIDSEDEYLLKKYKWYINSSGYLLRNRKMVNRKYLKQERYLHRIILKAKKGQIVDHINRDRLDNRRCNLRIVNKNQNCLNRTSTGGKLGIIGVRKVGNKYRAYISINYKQIHLGYFFTILDAKNARKKAYEKCF